MTRLVRVELRRLWLRRMTKLALVAGVLLIGLSMIDVVGQASPVSAADAVQSQQDFQRALRDWEVNGQQMLEDCRRSEQEARASDPGADYHCEDQKPKVEYFGRQPVPFADLARSGLPAHVFTLGFLAFLIGASFVAAEISTGAMGSWLTFEPRRTRVMLSKLGATALFLLPALALLTAAFVGAVYGVSSRSGTAGVTTAAEWSEFAWQGARLVGAGVVAGVVGACLGAILRHTAAAMGAVLAYSIAAEGLLRSWRPEIARYLVMPNVDAWVHGGSVFYVESCSRLPDGGYTCTQVERFISQGGSARFGLVAMAVLALLALLLFRRRDVT